MTPHLAIIVHRHIVPDVCERCINQDELVHAKEALTNLGTQQPQDRGLPTAASRLKGKLEDSLLAGEGSEPARHSGRVVRIAARCLAVEEHVAQQDGEDEPGAQREDQVDSQDLEDLPNGGDVRHAGPAHHEGSAGHHSLNPSVKEDVQDAAAKVMPEACQATCGFWALVCLAGSLAAQALELDRRIPEVAVVRLGGSFRQPGAHAAEAAFWKALRQVVVVAKEGVITHISDTGHLELSAVHVDAGQDVAGGKEATVADHQGLREHERLAAHGTTVSNSGPAEASEGRHDRRIVHHFRRLFEHRHLESRNLGPKA
mmetsp:Transcript_42294/g.100859  ORF Transcript_42294/g.100859 Transcript_42294/m.100859 type:complete len:315 (+) Transcript_42294:644-1588(+)